MDVILHLPSLSTLKRLSFTLCANLEHHTTHLGSVSVLSNLVNLSIKSSSLKSVTTFFSHIQLPKIKDISVSVSQYTPKQDIGEYWATIQRAYPSNTLASLAFSNIETLPDLDAFLTLHDLLPYKDFGNLRKIWVDVAWPVNLTDTDLLDLASTSPHLQEPSINKSWGWRMDREGGITLSGMVQLL